MDILVYLLVFGIGLAAASGPDYDELAAAIAEEPEAVLPEAEPEVVEPEVAEPEIAAPQPPAPKAVPGFAPRQPGGVAVAPAEPPAPASTGGWEAEDQTATGRMTTATEIRPILTVTKSSWIAVREWDGNDLLYFTNLLAWRCGLHEIRYAVNGGPEEVLEAEPCHMDEGAPNALKVDGVLPYVVLPPGSIETVTVSVLYDDLSTDTAEYSRQSVQIN